MQKILILVGAVILLGGILWPWLSKLPLGRLPGDLVIERGTYRIYLPLATSILLSLGASVLFWFFRK